MPKRSRRVSEKNPRRTHAWSPEMVSMLETLWSDGQTDLQIARALNKRFKTKLTRNAIQGKLQKLYVLGKKGSRRMPTDIREFYAREDVQQAMRSAVANLGHALVEAGHASGYEV